MPNINEIGIKMIVQMSLKLLVVDYSWKWILFSYRMNSIWARNTA